MRRSLIAIASSLLAVVVNAADVLAAPAVGQAFLERHCHACHAGEEAEAGRDLAALSQDLSELESLDRWVRIHDRIASGEMPPPGEERPGRAETREVLAALDGWLAAADRSLEEREGRTIFRRLTAAEYENALRELLAIPQVEVRGMLPADGTRRGFDKVGEGLDVSHVQIQQYLAAADRALDCAIATRPSPPPVMKKRFDVATMLKFRQALRSGNAVLLKGLEPDPAWYGDGRKDADERDAENAAALSADSSVGFFGPNVPGQEKFVSFIPIHPGRYRLRMSIWSFLWNDGRIEPLPRMEVAMLQAGKHVLGYYDAPSLAPQIHEVTAWLSDASAPMFDVASLTFQSGESRDRRPAIAVDWVEVEGPIHETWPPESHRRLFGDLPIRPLPAGGGTRPPARRPIREAKWAWPGLKDLPAAERQPQVASVSSDDPAADAKRLLAAFLPRAFRRPVSEQEVQRHVTIVAERLAKHDCFEDAMRQAYRAVLTSPYFLFRREAPGPLDDDAVATRLAFWLWNSPPDQELLQVAAERKLRDPAVVHGQIERLLEDPRSERFIVDFLDQWLNLKSIDDTDPDRKLYPEFQFFYLKDSMLAESRAFFRELIREDLPITSLVATDFAMLNERLVQHYRIPGLRSESVIGSEIRRVSLPPESHRGGFLSQGAVMKVTANGTTTSPVIRGAFLMERFLGDPIPPPPANVPAIEPDTQGATTIRAQLERHRSDAACAGCHKKMDPAGFALENFDVIGGWRDRYRSQGKGAPATERLFNGQMPTFRLGPPVDASGTMADGESFADFEEFRRILLKDRERLARAFVGHLVMYATGGEPSYADRRDIDAIVGATTTGGHGIRSLIHAVAKSRLFLDK
jgi:hypothetical protein